MACGLVGLEMDMHPPSWNKQPICSCQDSHNNTYACVRTLEPYEGGRDWTYCEFFTQEGQEYTREFYNLTRDAWQRVNEVRQNCRVPFQLLQGCVSSLRVFPPDADPLTRYFPLVQINSVDQSIIDAQHKRLEELRACSGATCRTTPSGTPEIWL